MAVRSNNITQANDGNRDQNSDKNFRFDICAITFRTNHGLLQDLNK